MKNPLHFIANLFSKRSYDVLDDFWYHAVTIPSKTGVSVDEVSALKNPTVWACVRAISETIASLPLFVYRRLPSGGKERAIDHPLYELLHLKPNPEMTSFQWREIMMGHVLLWGNHYSYLDWARNGRLLGIWPLRPDRMEIKRGTETFLEYHYRPTDGGPKEVYSSWEILHIPGLGYNGISGYPVITMAREAIGISMAAEELAARFYSNDATPPTVLQHPGRLSSDAHERLKSSWMTSHAGVGNKWKPAILEEGMTIQSIGMPYKDAQWMESRKFQVLEICRFFNVPPYKVMDFERATFSNVEQTAIDWVIHGIRPWLVRIEQAYQTKLFADLSMKDYFSEHLVDGLLRGDIASRYAAYAVGRNWGWLSADDIRERENMNPLPDGQGKVYLVPLNMVPADKIEEIAEKQVAPPAPVVKELAPPEEPEEEPEEEDITKRVKESFEPIFSDAIARILRRESIALKRAYAKKEPEIVKTEIDQFYITLPEFMSTTLTPALSSYASLIGSTETMNHLRSYIDNHIKESRADIEKWEGSPVEDNLTLWMKTRPEYNASLIQNYFQATS